MYKKHYDDRDSTQKLQTFISIVVSWEHFIYWN